MRRRSKKRKVGRVPKITSLLHHYYVITLLRNHLAAGQGIIEPNPEFEITKISDLADISNWHHHTSYILPQGRTVWWNPVQKAEDEFEEEEEEDEEREQPDEPEPETGPPLLTSASEDERKDMPIIIKFMTI